MLSRTVTLQTSPEASEVEYARKAALGIKALLIGCSDEVKARAIAAVYEGLDRSLQDRIQDLLGKTTPTPPTGGAADDGGRAP